jgi:hypothetical protein
MTLCILLDHDGGVIGTTEVPAEPNENVSLLIRIGDRDYEFEFEDWNGEDAIFRVLP